MTAKLEGGGFKALVVGPSVEERIFAASLILWVIKFEIDIIFLDGAA